MEQFTPVSFKGQLYMNSQIKDKFSKNWKALIKQV